MRTPFTRREFTTLSTVVASAFSTKLASARSMLVSTCQPLQTNKWVFPPGEETPKDRELIDRAGGLLASGRTPSEVLCDQAFSAVHPYPRFRQLIRKQATSAPLSLCAAEEPGERTILNLKI